MWMHSRRQSCFSMRSGWTGSIRRTLGSAALVAAVACAGSPHGPPVRVTIPAGATFRAAADSLGTAGVVRFPTLFRIYATLSGRDREIQAGTYSFQHGEPWSTLVHALVAGQGLERRLTIPEGWSLHEIVPALARATGAPEDSVWVAVRDTALRHELDVPAATVEGYLFPDTYIFPAGTSPRVAVRMMVQRFEAEWNPAWNARLQQLAMSRNDIVTLASIVEKEAKLPEERPVISAVYHNRLEAQMPLQADPTVQYALGAHHDRVLYKDLQVDSPYNTYRHRGLPPGPIASPGKPSIEAALYPASVPYLYFVAFPDGHHEFRTTFAGHTAARRAAKRAERRERRR